MKHSFLMQLKFGGSPGMDLSWCANPLWIDRIVLLCWTCLYRQNAGSSIDFKG